MNDQQPFIPYQIMEVELSQPIADLPIFYGQPQQRILVLVRFHSMPIGVMELDLKQVEHQEGAFTAECFAKEIWQELGEQINEHLVQDELPQITRLEVGGIRPTQEPNCLKGRTRLLANAPFVSIIVATHNRLETLVPCLDSLLAQEYPNFNIIVVDNAPSDNQTADYIRETYGQSTRVQYVREDLPGLARAHNCGLSVTNAPFVAITDDDVIADQYWLAEMMRGFHLEDKVGCVTGMIFPAEIETEAQYLIERSIGYAKGYTPRLFNLTQHRLAHPLYPYAAGTFGSGANMAFNVRILRSVGGFDDDLGAGSTGMGGDDLAAFFDIVSAGYTLVYQPSAIIYHRHHREYERLRKTLYGYGAGLTAYLTKTVMDRPSRIFDLARRIPYGLHHALSTKSDKNARKVVGYPGELTKLERKGMLAGPLLYLRGRLRARKAEANNKTKITDNSRETSKERLRQ